MPIYEFVCDRCNSKFEEIILGAEHPQPCPACRGGTRKVMSLPRSARFAGWYPRWVDKLEDHQKRQKSEGKEVTMPPISEIA